MPDADRPADANAPTEPGSYWLTSERDHDLPAEHVVEVGFHPWRHPHSLDDPDLLYVLEITLFCGLACTQLSHVRGTWGSRVPTSPRLEAMEAVVAHDKIWAVRDEGGFIVACQLCHALVERVPNDRGGCTDRITHTLACVWKRSQRKPQEAH